MSTLARLLWVSLLPLSLIAAEREISITDWTGRGFPADLVSYDLDPLAAGKVATLRLTDESGTAVPLQFTIDAAGKSQFAFVTGVKPNATVKLRLRDGGGPMVGSAVAVDRSAEGLILRNGLLAVLLPAEGKREAMPASALPAPILGFRDQAATTWLGGGRLATERMVKSLEVQVTASGPVFAEARYTLLWADGGSYRATIRVVDQAPLAQITEEIDLVSSENLYWTLDLTKGWLPTRFESASTAGNGGVDVGKIAPLSELAPTPTPITGAYCLNPNNAWGERSHIGLMDDATRLVGFAPLHKGDWRHLQTVEIRRSGTSDLTLAFPLNARQRQWAFDCTSDTSPFSFQKIDPAAKPGQLKRVWGLVLAAPTLAVGIEARPERKALPIFAARVLYGVVGLDRYKDFILSWPDAKTAYPRVFIPQDQLEHYRKTWQQSPLADKLGAWYCLTGDAAKAKLRLVDFIKQVNFAHYMLTTPTSGHHHQIEWVMQLADDLLSWPELSADDRVMIRRWVALLAYLHIDPDYSGHGTGGHDGNANMGLARQLYAPLYVGLIPDHPMAKEWAGYLGENIAYHLGTHQVPGGGWSEYGSAYHAHGYKAINRGINGLIALDAPHLSEILAYNRDNFQYALNTLTPYDPQWFSRVQPGLANSSTGYVPMLIEAMGALSVSDPKLAAEVKWGWQQSGSPSSPVDEGLDRPWITPSEPRLASAVVPGIGVFFRAHQGPEETYMWLRSGFCWGHWPEDQNHLILYSLGAVLLPPQPFQYWFNTPDWDNHNVMRFGHPNNTMPHAWSDSNVLDAHFGESVEYAISSTGFADWFISPGAATAVGNSAVRPQAEGAVQKQGAFDWDRVVVFLKGATATSPTYFVVHDGISGPGELASWSFWNFLGRTANLTIGERTLHAATGFAADLDITCTTPLTGLVTREQDQVGGPFVPNLNEPWFRLAKGQAISPFWSKKGKELAPRPNVINEHLTPSATDKAAYPDLESHVFVRYPSAPHQGRTYVLYPQAKNAAKPVITTLADEVVSVQTSEGTDYVFASHRHLDYSDKQVVFSGTAGAVRVRADHVVLSLFSGQGSVSYRGTVLSGQGPLERRIALADLKPGAVLSSTQPAAPIGDVLAQGVTRERVGALTRYRVAAAKPLVYSSEGVSIEGEQATIEQTADGIRFIVPVRSYAKLSIGNVGVKGFGPFDLTFKLDGIAGTVSGTTRSLSCTWPDQLLRPGYWMDGRRYYAHNADDHSITKGTATPQFALAFAVTSGEHTIRLAPWTYPMMPPLPQRAVMSLAGP